MDNGEEAKKLLAGNAELASVLLGDCPKLLPALNTPPGITLGIMWPFKVKHK